MHLNEDILIFQREYIDKSTGRFMLIITDFRRTAQPIIRDRLNDILLENTEPCQCGSLFRRIEKIERSFIYKQIAACSKVITPSAEGFISLGAIMDRNFSLFNHGFAIYLSVNTST